MKKKKGSNKSFRLIGSYHPAGQSSGHTLPTLADLTQGAAPPPPHQPPPRYAQHQQPPHSGGHSLSGISQPIQHSPPQSSINRDREREPRDRERELLERHREEELMQRERENREQMERYHRDQQQHHPVQSHTGSIPIHQPVASKVPNSIHGPNGLLSNLGVGGASNPPQSSLQAPSAPGSLFGNQVQSSDGSARPYLHQVQGPPQQPVLPYNGGSQQMPGSVAALAQGQQPILNVSHIWDQSLFNIILLFLRRGVFFFFYTGANYPWAAFILFTDIVWVFVASLIIFTFDQSELFVFFFSKF